MLAAKSGPGARARFRSELLLGSGTLLAGLTVLFMFDPTRFSFYPVCLFHRVTGWNCPGCGGMRGLHALLHGDVMTALRDNPLVMLSIPWLSFLSMRWLSRELQGRSRPWPDFAPGKVAWILALLVVFTILRNIPCAPFIYLSPP